MTLPAYLLILAAALIAVLLLTLAPQPFLHITGRLCGNTLAGLALLLLINAFSRRSGLIVPLNWCTLAAAAVLGAPGMAAMAALAAV